MPEDIDNNIDDDVVYIDDTDISQDTSDYNRIEAEYNDDDDEDDDYYDAYSGNKEEPVSEKEDTTENITEPVYEPPPKTYTIFDKEFVEPKFKDDTERANYFETAYHESRHAFYNNVKENILNNYKDELLKIDGDIEIAREMVNAMQDGSILSFLRKNFAKELTSNSYNIKYSDDEIQNIVHSKLSEKFGENYLDEYDVNQLRLVNSKSYKIFKEQEKIIDELEKENANYTPTEPTAVQEQRPRLTPEQEASILNENFSSFDRIGMDRNTYDKWVKEDMQKTFDNLSLIDLYKIQNFSKIITLAKEAGRKEVARSIKASTNGRVDGDKNKVSQQDGKYDELYSYYDIQLNRSKNNR